MAKVLNEFATNPSCVGLFETNKANVYVAVVKPSDKGAYPIALDFNNLFKPEAMFPYGTDIKEQASKSEFLQRVMKKNSYPSIGYEYGSFNYEELPIDTDWAIDFPLVKFVDRILSKATKAVNPKKFVKAVSSFYGEVSIDTSEHKKLDVSLSYSYEPFKKIVEEAKSRKEASYVFNKEAEDVYNEMVLGNVRFIALLGPPATGKTSFLVTAAIRMGLPFVQSSGNFTDTDQLEGAYGVSKDGNVAFIPGPLLECYEHGGLYIMDEANYTPAQVNATIQAMTDGSVAIVQKTTKEIIKRHPNFILGFTWNPDAKGAYPFNAALFDRMDTVIALDKDTPEELFRKLKHNHSDMEKGFLKKLSQVPNIVEAWAKQLGSNGYCSLRQLDNFINVLDHVDSFDLFKFMFDIRIFNPTCLCNSYKPEKIKGILSSDEYNNLLKDLYDEIDLSNLESTDYEWLLSSSSEGLDVTSDDDFDGDEVTSLMDNIFNVSTTK